jgi:hypothetical protein
VALAWVLLFGGPALAAVVAARRHGGLDGPDDPEQVRRAGLRQAGAAGFLATAVGALTVTALGTATVALMPRAGWLMRWLYPGQHLTTATAYLRELTASVRVGHYGLTLMIFPVIGILMGLWAGASVAYSDPAQDGGGPAEEAPCTPGAALPAIRPGGGQLL